MKITVVGAGVWGTSTAYYLRKMGVQVELIDMWGPGNVRSGSGGASRIIRLVYGPDDVYIDLTARSFHLWNDLFQKNAKDYYQETGLLWLFSQEDDSYAADSKRRIEALGFELEELDITDTQLAYPQISLTGIRKVYFEDKAGILYASKCCELLLQRFQEIGGHYMTGHATVDEQSSDFSLLINGKKAVSDQYIFACGPWTRNLFPGLLKKYTYVSKQDVYHFVIPPERMRLFDTSHLPVWLDYNVESPLYYGMPMHLAKGFKIAYDDRSEIFNPDQDDRLPNLTHLTKARKFIDHRFPLLTQAPVAYTEVCQYDNSLDGHFIVDMHPQFKNVLVMTGSSGHGFKMGPALGETVSRHLLKGSPLPEQFRLNRFLNKSVVQSQFIQKEKKH
ncbi:MAG: FAD-dependent oxidoreductase [Saprospiraceae bacterium]|nr:FAD-dependent oxidoreductase [Saprospiraceae bacterium]